MTTDEQGHAGEPNYSGPERRVRSPSVIVEQHAGSPMPPGYKDMAMWQKAWANFGALGVGCLMLVVGFLFFQDQYRSTMDYQRQRDTEDREIRRAEINQQDRRGDQMATELRLMRVSFDAVATRIEASAARAEAVKSQLERLSRELSELVKKLLEAMNNPAALIKPVASYMGWMKAEVAPMPREVTDGGSSPR